MDKLLNKHCFMMNSMAMGDVIAAVPVVKYMIERYHPTPTTYIVCAKEMFRPLFPFVPDSSWRNHEQQENNWNMTPDYVMSLLNAGLTTYTRGTPKHMHLGQFASVKLADRILPPRHLQYVPLKPVDVSHFGIDFSKAALLSSCYRDTTRMWHNDSMLEVAAFIRARGYTPIFIGKTNMNEGDKKQPQTALPADVSAHGIDLRNQTTIAELASMMGQSAVVLGVDGGPMHLAGTTSVPIVCGYTSILAEHRIPHRPAGRTYPVSPEIECIGCESTWCGHLWNYEFCYLKHENCCKFMTADLFIKPLKKILK